MSRAIMTTAGALPRLPRARAKAARILNLYMSLNAAAGKSAAKRSSTRDERLPVPVENGYVLLMENGIGNDLTDREREEIRQAPNLARAIELTRRELADLRAEHDDLKLLYETTIAHGVAVEDQLAESNILLQRTQARLEEELGEASRYVQSILPEPRSTVPKTDWLFVSSTELGGDSLGYHHIDENHFAIYLIDVCGHGIGAALLSATVINVLRAGSLPNADFRDPGSVLASLNDAFPMEKQNQMFFTIWYGVYHVGSCQLRYSSGGHPPAILLRPGAGDKVKAVLLGDDGNLAIGAIIDVRYSNGTAVIEPGDKLLVLSDGTYEIERADGRLMTLEDLTDFMSADMQRGPSEVYAWVHSINGGGPLPDDFSLVEIRF